MARAIINADDQAKRIQLMRERIIEFKNLDIDILTKSPREKSWSIIEVIEHMVIAHRPYSDKIDNCLQNLEASNSEMKDITAKALPSYLFKKFPPSEGKIKMKMRTSKKFQPIFKSSELDAERTSLTFSNFENSLNHLEAAIKSYPMKKVKSKRFSSAVGAAVKFNVAEACEFVICHNERHLLQAENTLREIRS